MTDPIRTRLDELKWETNCFWIASDALLAVLDLADAHYDVATGINIRLAIADALGVEL